MSDAHKNFAYSTVATAPSPATTGTSMVLASGGGALMPTVPFNLTVWSTGVQPLASNAEIVRVTNISTDTLTIVRQQEGTSARTIVVGDQAGALITKATLNDIEQELAPSRDVILQAGFSFYKFGYSEVPAGFTSEVGDGAFSEVG